MAVTPGFHYNISTSLCLCVCQLRTRCRNLMRKHKSSILFYCIEGVYETENKVIIHSVHAYMLVLVLWVSLLPLCLWLRLCCSENQALKLERYISWNTVLLTSSIPDLLTP